MLNKSKKKNKLFDNKGLSLIEVLIVMAITGMTLIALLNLARRDLVIEKLNEEHDIASTIALAQMQEFDNIKELNPSCLQTLYNNYVSNGTNTYFACDSNYGNLYNSTNFPGITPVSACNNDSGQAAWLYGVYNGTFTQVDTNSYPAYLCNPTTPAAPSATYIPPVYYMEQLKIVSANTSNHTLQIQSNVQTYGIDQRFFSTYEDETYFL